LKINGGEDVGVYGKCEAGNCYPLDTDCDRAISRTCAYYWLPIHFAFTLAIGGRIVLWASVGNYSSDISVSGLMASAS